MAHMWKRNGEAWEIESLEDGRPWSVRQFGSGAAASAGAGPVAPLVRVAHDTAADGRARWVLLAARGAPVRVNGRRVSLGVCALRDRDEIRFDDGEVFYFTTERHAIVEPFPGSPRPTYCPRCRKEIRAGEPAVCCPNDACAVWYHESPGQECWTYADSCALCGQPTALDAGFRWTPEEVCA